MSGPDRFLGIEMARRGIPGEAAPVVFLRSVFTAAAAAAPAGRKLVVRARTDRVFDPGPERELRQAISAAAPSAHDLGRGVPARLVARAAGGTEIAVSWPAPGAPAAPADSFDVRLTIRWPLPGEASEADEAAALTMVRAFAQVLEPACIEAGPLWGRERSLREAWLAMQAEVGTSDFVRTWPAVRNVELPGGGLGRVAHEGSPFSELWSDAEQRRELLAFARRVRVPIPRVVAAAPAPVDQAEPLVEHPAPVVVGAPAVTDATLDIEGGRAPTGPALPFPAVVADRTLAIDAQAEMLSSESGFREELTAVPVPEMPLEQYAAFQAEIRMRGSLTASIARRYGVPSEAVQRALQERYRKAFQADPTQADRFGALVKQFLAVFGPKGG